jgi:GAF domain-containing protein
MMLPPSKAARVPRQRRARQGELVPSDLPHRPVRQSATGRHPMPSLQPNDAFAELARLTLSEQSLDTVMDTIAGLTKQTIPGASEVSVTLLERNAAKTVASTGRLATDLDERQYDRGYGPCLDCVVGGEPVVINDLAADHRWQDWGTEAARRGAGSSMSIPVPVQREVSAALNIYSSDPNAFDADSIELGKTFSAYAGVALANMHLYQAQERVVEQLQTAMESRAAIEQAKGILMGQRRCGPQEAFDILVKLSQDTNRKLRDVAQALVDEAAVR